MALKSLADITERSKNYPESIRWLKYLLEIDRNNDEAQEQLLRVTEAAEAPQPEEAPTEETPAEPEEVEADRQHLNRLRTFHSLNLD